MRSFIIIAALFLVVVFTLRVVGPVLSRMGDGAAADGAMNSARSTDAPSPEQAKVEKLQDQQEMVEQREALTQEIQTAPLERQTELMEQQQQVIEQHNELTKERIGAAYDAEIERLEQERKLLEAQEALKRQQEKQAEERVQEQPQFKPVTRF